ncbi:hypothetical protein AGABI2DRAFT_120496 [Agaricus bisporus var. bisporus H97]|uniref:hypothetical protein n=1 Tax=Agaricus bisporus var. bisporus (strain H97 / ATCC MYA-4626 / FGSC 10389) TaxID=936046 RepID=UPI00029F7858|nr:hypothetical protein AGABI2DRAFT_120496 [Agaricus bisporus var. bisporus H97]EKV44366.1 hypothetical protein AGABI2DRAFT_120496 [Agaricus bisporus var. bisporus H97]
MVLPAVFSLFFPWRSRLPNRLIRRPETDIEVSSPGAPISPSSSPHDANGKEIFTTHSNSSFRRDRDQAPASPDHHQQPDNSNANIRSLPLISSIFVPFSILLAVPGLTDHWYIRTNDQHQILDFEPNPLYLRVMLGFSMAFAVIANLCLLVRLFEKMVRWMTIICIILLTLHDILDISVIIIFTIKTQVDDGFILGQAFWATLCSTIAAFMINITLVLDYLRTSGAERDESGLTKKQRTLAINMIGLLCYIAFGAAIHLALISLSYIDALYFTVVSILTVGLGDITPRTPGARIFTSLYTAAGIVIIAINIGLIRESLLEVIRHNMYARIHRRRKRRIKYRWEIALKWRLEHAGLPIWIPISKEEEREEEEAEEYHHYSGATGPTGKWKNWRPLNAIWLHTLRGLRNLKTRRSYKKRHMRLNLRGLTDAQLQAAAMEAGAPLKELLPAYFHSRTHHEVYGYVGGEQAMRTTPTHYRMGMMITLLGDFAYSFTMGQHGSSRRIKDDYPGQLENADDESGGDGLALDEPQMEERRHFVARIVAALACFFTFWLVGSAIFSATEGWSYGLSLYFCFFTFITVGYGDPVPKTAAGRSIFVGWALCGVGTMTILISRKQPYLAYIALAVLADRYTEEYKRIISDTQTMKPEGLPPTKGIQDTTRMTIVSPTPPIMQNHDDAVFGNQELLSRVDTLKELIVDEGLFREGRLLHTLESQFNQKQAKDDIKY